MPVEHELLVAWTRTGEVIDRLHDADWGGCDESVHWSDIGRGTFTVPITTQVGSNRALLRGMAQQQVGMTVVVASAGRALWAGLVTGAPWGPREVRVTCSTLPRLFDSRMLIGNDFWGWPNDPQGDLHFELGTRDLVIELLTQGSTGYRRDLPLLLPAQSGESGPAVDYKASDLTTVYEAVKEVCDRDDGPDVWLRPELYADGDMLRWVAEVGDPALGTGPTWRDGDPSPVWDWPVNITDLTGDPDGSEMVSTGYVPGTAVGGADSRLIGVAVRDRGDPLPALERADRATTSETRLEQLNARAAAYIEANAWPTHSLDIELLADHTPVYLRDWALGDIVRVRTDGSHGWLDEPGSGGREIVRRVVGASIGRDRVRLSTTDGSEVGLPRWAG